VRNNKIKQYFATCGNTKVDYHCSKICVLD
jgi:hypothetical protein